MVSEETLQKKRIDKEDKEFLSLLRQSRTAPKAPKTSVSMDFGLATPASSSTGGLKIIDMRGPATVVSTSDIKREKVQKPFSALYERVFRLKEGLKHQV